MSIFNKISLRAPSASWFDMSYDHKTTCDMGFLVPVHLQECLPTDKYVCSTEAMLRFQPMIAPIMHKVNTQFHWFFVPNRIVWPNWEKFITGGSTGEDIISPPRLRNLSMGTIAPQSLGDYMGLPLGDYTGNTSEFINAIPFMGYHRIYQEWFRDQNLEAPEAYNPLELQDGEQTADVTTQLLKLRRRAWQHDYFTSCLPNAQKGATVELPIDITINAPVKRVDNAQGWTAFLEGTNTFPAAGDIAVQNPGGDVIMSGTSNDISFDPNEQLYVEENDVSTATTINDLRIAVRLQMWLEKNMRAGTRYVESLLAHFGQKPLDARLQRPELIGSSSANMAISEVLQMSSTDPDSTPQGNMAGHGIAVAGGSNINYRCTEHGYMFCIMSVRPQTAYSQGLPKHFSKKDRLAYYWPLFAQLGEEPVLKKEVFYDFITPGPTNNDATFGYLPRYTEYRYNNGRISGEMRTNLNYWHLGRQFEDQPSLNADFVACNPDPRIFAVEDAGTSQLICHIYNKIRVRRPMPKYGNPGSL